MSWNLSPLIELENGNSGKNRSRTGVYLINSLSRLPFGVLYEDSVASETLRVKEYLFQTCAVSRTGKFNWEQSKFHVDLKIEKSHVIFSEYNTWYFIWSFFLLPCVFASYWSGRIYCDYILSLDLIRWSWPKEWTCFIFFISYYFSNFFCFSDR